MKRLFLTLSLALSCSLCVSVFPGTVRADEITLMAVGDVLPHASWQPFEAPVSRLLDGVVGTLFEADIVVGNLETPLTNQVKPTASKSRASLDAKTDYLFKTESEDAAQGLRDSGFTVLTLANNHVMDYREAGLTDTLARLDKAEIKTTGAGISKDAFKPAVVDAKGIEVVFISGSDIVPEGTAAKDDKQGVASIKDTETFIKRIKAARADYPDAILALSLHWGVLSSYTPTSRQKELARKFIDAGADLIIGHHPHSVQGVELYKGKPIFYSLGNFLFDSKDPADKSVIARIAYSGKTHTPSKISIIPVLLKDGGFPVVLDEKQPEYGQIREKLIKVSEPLGTTLKGLELVPLSPAIKTKAADYWGA